ncbi:helix-turn-helix domain-containing protein [Streptomyces sp. NA04227]|nr:helix-turn-helix domain-containing protein [Streptomyces sp. NA04227]
MAGRQLKLWREAAGLSRADFGGKVGYGGEMVGSMERGRRKLRPEFLELADKVLGARGHLEALQEDLKEAKSPRRAKNLARLEAQAVELAAYSNHTIQALLQTEGYARALYAMRRPMHSEEAIERSVADRMARQTILDNGKVEPMFTFVQEEVTLRRPIGGKMVHRQQLERLLAIGQLRNVEIQVMPTDLEDHAGLTGAFRLFKLRDGSTLGYSEAQKVHKLITDAAQVQSLEIQYGTIRAQALGAQESLAFIETLLGET